MVLLLLLLEQLQLLLLLHLKELVLVLGEAAVDCLLHLVLVKQVCVHLARLHDGNGTGLLLPHGHLAAVRLRERVARELTKSAQEGLSHFAWLPRLLLEHPLLQDALLPAPLLRIGSCLVALVLGQHLLYAHLLASGHLGHAADSGVLLNKIRRALLRLRLAQVCHPLPRLLRLLKQPLLLYLLLKLLKLQKLLLRLERL